ncbi:DUF1579 family protein [Algoriphagus terrigena]|uniref:DUF1579 family protein n=1 Tax=Algoriphagus terrigena TaxID=344884 RepID=UPI0004175C69|nr:DUF1579 family protein [Algoriphagus terrigena]
MTKIANSSFRRLLGVWKTSGQILSGDSTLSLAGTDSYELILNGNYILHKAAVMMGDEKSETFEIVGLDGSSEKAAMNYFNANGESGTMTGQIEGDDFLINGDGLKFSGKINEANTAVIGKWLQQAEDNSWVEFIDLKLEKQK